MRFLTYELKTCVKVKAKLDKNWYKVKAILYLSTFLCCLRKRER